MAIKVQNLKKSFTRKGNDTLQVLDGVSFHVSDGEFVTLLGPSGCGKTTLLKIIAGIERMDEGVLEPMPSQANFLPIIWQEHRLFPWRTVLGNVAFPLELRNAEESFAKTKVLEMLKSVKLEAFADYYPWQISSGMAQRAAIARALVTDSKCVLMDEPFASVDYQTKQSLFQQLQELRRSQGLTILYVTHDLRDAIMFSDRIVVLSAIPTKVREIIQPTSADLPHSQLEEHLWKLLR